MALYVETYHWTPTIITTVNNDSTSSKLFSMRWGGSMKLWNLALSNMKGYRSSIISLFIMIMIASILLNVSLTIAIKMNTFFDNKFEQLQEPNINLLLDRSDEQQVYYDYIKQDPRVAASEREAVIWAAGRFSYGDNDMSIGIAVQQAEH